MTGLEFSPWSPDTIEPDSKDEEVSLLGIMGHTGLTGRGEVIESVTETSVFALPICRGLEGFLSWNNSH